MIRLELNLDQKLDLGCQCEQSFPLTQSQNCTWPALLLNIHRGNLICDSVLSALIHSLSSLCTDSFYCEQIMLYKTEMEEMLFQVQVRQLEF